MDNDERLSLAEKFAESNSDEDEIDSDLEAKLYAAVFHSTDISSKSQEIPEYDNFKTLTDVVGSWKNIADVNSGDLLSAETVATRYIRESPHPASKFDKNFIASNVVDECYVEDLYSTKLGACRGTVGSRNDERNDETEILRDGNRLESCDTSIAHQKLLENITARDVCTENEVGIDVRNDTEIVARPETVQTEGMVQESRENLWNNEKRSLRENITKRQKISHKKLSKSKDSTLKSSGRNNNTCDANTCAENDPIDYSVRVPGPEDATESSDIKAEDNQSMEERTCSFGNETCGVEEGADGPSSIKPEEEFEKVRSMNCEITDKESNEIADVKPEEERLEKVQSMENDVSNNSSDSLSSDTSSSDSSSSSLNQNTQNIESREISERILSVVTERSEIITLDDSEDSIFEVPVPPKPRPPTINLEDSDSSSSSDSATTSETMSPKKLIENYKLALSKCGSRNKQAGRRTESTAVNKTLQEKAISSTDSSTSDSDDSMTESEEENWGIIAGSQMNKDKPSQSSSRDVEMSEMIENFATDVERQGSSCPTIEHGDESTNLVSEINANLIRESPENMSNEFSPQSPLDTEKQSSEAKRLSQTGQISGDNGEKEKSQEIDEKLIEDDTIIINAESITSLSNIDEDREPVTPTRTSENRKRSMPDSGKKSKQNSPKKAKSSNDSAAAGSSGHKVRKKNKENKDKRRNCAADYFFKPMTSEMENFYNKSWGGENFDIDAIQREMSRDPRHWAVLNEDLVGHQQRRSRYWIERESRCRNCNHTGHRMAECPEKRKVPCCHMCGARGHRELQCPHKMCLGCGTKTKLYKQICCGCRRAWCNRCQSHGHVDNNCPDLWRRYHLTTSFRDVNTQLNPTDVMKPQHLLSCCICAKRGHDSTTCVKSRGSRHFRIPAYVTNYTAGPGYDEDPVLEEVGFSTQTAEQTDTEKRYADSSAPHTSSVSNEGARRKSTADKVTNENPVANKVLQTTSKEADISIDKTVQRSKEQSRSDRDKAQKSNEPLPTNSETKKDEEILLMLESEVLASKLSQASNFCEYKVPLYSKSCEEIVESELGRQFLLNLTLHFPMKIEVRRSREEKMEMTITCARKLRFPLRQAIIDWLKWLPDERSRFVSFNLPRAKKDLIKLLSRKLDELNQDLGDPLKLNEHIESLKSELQRQQNHSKPGKKGSRRARIVDELATSQCKLNMVLIGQLIFRKCERSSRHLSQALNTMQTSPNPSDVSDGAYLQLIHHYNRIFAAYTPRNLPKLLDIYWQEHSGSMSDRREKLTTWDMDVTYNNFIESLRETNENWGTSSVSPGGSNLPFKDSMYIDFLRSIQEADKKQDVNSSSPGGSNLSVNTGNQVLPQNVTNERQGSCSTSNTSVNYDGVQRQFEVPEADVNFDFNSQPRLESPPLMKFPVEKRASNYNNSRFNFRDTSSLRRQADIPVQRNRQPQEDYIALEYHGSLNNHYNAERDSNETGGDFYRRPREPYLENGATRIFMDPSMRNGFPNTSERNIQSDSFPRESRWQDSYVPRIVSSTDVSYTDPQAESSRNNCPNEEISLSSRIEGERKRVRWEGNGPSISGVPNQLRIPADNNPGFVSNKQQQKVDNTKNKKKKKKSKEMKLPLYLQKRAAKNIVKYIDIGFPRVSQAAIKLQEKLNNNDITLRCVKKFEGLIKHKLKKTVHLL